MSLPVATGVSPPPCPDYGSGLAVVARHLNCFLPRTTDTKSIRGVPELASRHGDEQLLAGDGSL